MSEQSLLDQLLSYHAHCTIWIGDFVGIVLLPIAIWSIIKHRAHQNTKPSPPVLYRLNMVLYSVSIIASICLFVVPITSCLNMDSSLFLAVWLVQQFAWMIQWTLLLLIFFFRLYFVFRGTSHQLSKFSVYFFAIIFCLFILMICGSFLGLLAENDDMMAGSLTLYSVLALLSAL
eukprot:UN06171